MCHQRPKRTAKATKKTAALRRQTQQNALKRAALDNIRINRFFLTGQVISFIDNQKALQKSNKKLKGYKGLVREFGDDPDEIRLKLNQIYDWNEKK